MSRNEYVLRNMVLQRDIVPVPAVCIGHGVHYSF
jgi:hypothetical protein